MYPRMLVASLAFCLPQATNALIEGSDGRVGVLGMGPRQAARRGGMEGF